MDYPTQPMLIDVEETEHESLGFTKAMNLLTIGIPSKIKTGEADKISARGLHSVHEPYTESDEHSLYSKPAFLQPSEDWIRTLLRVQGGKFRSKGEDATCATCLICVNAKSQAISGPKMIAKPMSSSSYGKHATLDKMPFEILSQVCSNLDAIWVYNLSHVSSRIYNNLNGAEANIIWYKCLPTALWRKSEHHQNHMELYEWMTQAKAKALLSKTDECHGLPCWAPGSTESKSEEFSRPAKSLIRDHRPAPLDLTPVTLIDRPITSGITGLPSAIPFNDMNSVSSSMFDVDEEVMISQHSAKRIKLTPGSTDYSGSGGIDTLITAISPMHSLFSEPISDATESSLPNITDGMLDRKPVLALGGPFQPIFSYKREILGHISGRKRCFICLNKKSFFNNLPADLKHWGMLWCEDCLRGHTVSMNSIEIMVSVINSQAKDKPRFSFPYTGRLKQCSIAGRLRFFVPHVSKVFVAHGYYPVEILKRQRDILITKEARKFKRDNPLRRRLRQLITCAAEQIWEGYDPSPIFVHDKIANTTVYIGREHINESRFATWRDRFAPTSMLKEILFPIEMLNDGAAVNRDQDWAKAIYLPDPVDEISLPTIRKLLGNGRWISDTAEEMLDLLTDWNHEDYQLRGYGGSCTTWVEAARKYHRARLEKEVDECIAKTKLSLFAFKSQKMANSLMQRLGIDKLDAVKESENYEDIRGLFKVPSLTAPTDSSPREMFKQSESLKERELDMDNRLHYAKKILLGTCKRCPENRLIVTKKGVDATLDHMRDGHPELYWISDEWSLIG